MVLSNPIGLCIELYDLCEKGCEDEALQKALCYAEERLRNGHFDEVDRFLDYLKVTNLSSVVLLTILTITWHGKDRLLRREDFRVRSREQMIREWGEERTEKLLKTR